MSTVSRVSVQPMLAASRRGPQHVPPSRTVLPPMQQLGPRNGTIRSRRTSHLVRFKHATAAELDKRISDLATRKRYLTNFWYAASFTKKISHQKPVATFLLDTNVLIWRDNHSGEVVCITATDPTTLQDLSEKDVELTVYNTSEETQKTAMYAPAQPHAALDRSQPGMMCQALFSTP